MLTIDHVARMMKCPTCGAAGLTLADGAVACPQGHEVAVQGNSVQFEGAQAGLSEEWQAQQEIGASDYAEGEGLSQGADALARLFGGFMAVSLRPEHKVIDIGCGMSGKLPGYVSELGLQAYIGLEPLPVAASPAYPLFSGAIAEKLPLRDGVLDAAMFATSMDRIEDIDSAVAEAKRVVGPDGRLYMWIGLYDPEEIARAKTFYNVLLGSRVKRTARLLAAHVEYAHTLWKMRDRKRRLAKGIRIDPYHCRYYTRDRVKASLAQWGLKEVRSLVVPGAPSMFVEAVPA